MSGIVFSAIAPHGGLVIPELCGEDELALAAETRRAMEELGRRFEVAGPEAAIVLTPHNVHVEGAVAVVVAGSLEGSLGGPDGRVVSMSCPIDLRLAVTVLRTLVIAGVPTLGISFGASDPAEATMPLDWGALVPLWFMGGRAQPPVPVVLVSPPRDVPGEVLVAAGRALAAAAAAHGKRVALIASADHGHAHGEEGPYGFDPAAAIFDALVVRLVRENRLAGLLELDPDLVEAARVDSLWQMLVLHGAVEGSFEAELLSYEAPTYFGMLCAAFVPRA